MGIGETMMDLKKPELSVKINMRYLLKTYGQNKERAKKTKEGELIDSETGIRDGSLSS